MPVRAPYGPILVLRFDIEAMLAAAAPRPFLCPPRY